MLPMKGNSESPLLKCQVIKESGCWNHEESFQLHQLGLDWSTSDHGPIRNVNGVCGCGGTISRGLKAGALGLDYVIEPSQIQSDLEQGGVSSVPVPSDYMGKETVVTSLAANVEAMIRADRKVTALKQLQGHIWRTGFQCSELVGMMYDDVPEALERWHALGMKVYIYSSGSREAQQLLFGNSNYGDLRKYLCGFFDTTVGSKKEMPSYVEILKTVGVDRPADMLFVTDAFEEAIAARAAGLEVIASLRPGNGPLPENHGFRTIESLFEI